MQLADDAVAMGVLPEAEFEAQFGIINGVRMLQIQNAYIESFFDKWFQEGSGELLDGRVNSFPRSAILTESGAR